MSTQYNQVCFLPLSSESGKGSLQNISKTAAAAGEGLEFFLKELIQRGLIPGSKVLPALQ